MKDTKEKTDLIDTNSPSLEEIQAGVATGLRHTTYALEKVAAKLKKQVSPETALVDVEEVRLLCLVNEGLAKNYRMLAEIKRNDPKGFSRTSTKNLLDRLAPKAVPSKPQPIVFPDGIKAYLVDAEDNEN